MVWTIGKQKKKAAILPTIVKQNTIRKQQTPNIWILNVFGIPAPTALSENKSYLFKIIQFGMNNWITGISAWPKYCGCPIFRSMLF